MAEANDKNGPCPPPADRDANNVLAILAALGVDADAIADRIVADHRTMRTLARGIMPGYSALDAEEPVVNHMPAAAAPPPSAAETPSPLSAYLTKLWDERADSMTTPMPATPLRPLKGWPASFFDRPESVGGTRVVPARSVGKSTSLAARAVSSFNVGMHFNADAFLTRLNRIHENINSQIPLINGIAPLESHGPSPVVEFVHNYRLAPRYPYTQLYMVSENEAGWDFPGGGGVGPATVERSEDVVKRTHIASAVYPASLLNPPVPCPACGQPVRGFAGAQAASDAAAAVVGVAAPRGQRAAITYTLTPCYCRVDRYWAEAMSNEMTRRGHGQPPQDVRGLSMAAKEATRRRVEADLTSLYARRDMARYTGGVARRATIEREIVELIQQLAEVCPDAEIPPLDLVPEVLQWATQRQMVLPPTCEAPRLISEAMARATDPNNGKCMLTPAMIHRHLTFHPEYSRYRAKQLVPIADQMYQELADFTSRGKPVSCTTRDVLATLVPGGERIPYSVEAAGPVVDDHPDEVFARQLARRPGRRQIEVIHRKPRTPPPPAEPEADDDTTE